MYTVCGHGFICETSMGTYYSYNIVLAHTYTHIHTHNIMYTRECRRNKGHIILYTRNNIIYTRGVCGDVILMEFRDHS